MFFTQTHKDGSRLVSKAELLEITQSPEEAVSNMMDTKLVVLDIIRQQLSDEQINTLFWTYLEYLKPEDVSGYFFRKRS